MDIFKDYSPLKDKIFHVMDNDGKIINTKWFPELSDERILKAYKDMLFARTADLMAVSFQRQGRMYTYPPNLGQEAISCSAGMVMKEDDWLVPAFREIGAYLAKGIPLRDIFLNFIGNEHGGAFSSSSTTMPMSVPISSQLPHATGIGYAIKYKKENKVVFAFVGDGGTSEGDFHEALNFAGVWKVPVIFIVQNNQFAISVPFRIQTASENIAVKSIAYGIQGIKVDGNDLFAMYKVMEAATEYVRNGNGPVLIEALTYRKGAHTTSDDPTKYRTKDEEEQWAKTDPLDRLHKYLVYNNLWSEEQEVNIVSEFKKEVENQFSEAENYTPYPYQDVFDYNYVEMPDDLKVQKMEFEKFLSWKEARK
jgi:pyruvate dehydrogenase E1 component alpha subunit